MLLGKKTSCLPFQKIQQTDPSRGESEILLIPGRAGRLLVPGKARRLLNPGKARSLIYYRASATYEHHRIRGNNQIPRNLLRMKALERYEDSSTGFLSELEALIIDS
jgi:hypothetical protein